MGSGSGNNVSHIITEESIAYLLLCKTPERREQAIRGVAGSTPVGMARDKRIVENLRDRMAIQRPEDLGIKPGDSTRCLLSAKTFEEITELSGGLYHPPDQCRMTFV